MATDVDQTFYGWSKDEFSDRDDSQEDSVSQMRDHGSISFGRFAAESLSWERRSVFTHDRRREELKKVNGLVAKKKAYFEEYYKRLRALKALQQNQQTELTLDYGGDGSNSSQTAEDDETALQVGTLRHGAAETIDASSGEPTNELTFAQDMNCRENLQTSQLCPGSTTSDMDPLRKNMEKIEPEKNSNRAVQTEDLERESLLSLTRSTEEIEQNDISSVDGKEILGGEESLASNVESGPAPTAFVSDLTNSRASESQLAPDYNFIPDKTKLAVEKSPEGKLVPEVKKEPAASVRTGLESTDGTRREVVKSLRGAKHPGQKLIGKADGQNPHSGKAIASKVTGNHRSASVASRRSVTEVCSSITSARPFSPSMERRSGIRESAVRSDSKTSNGLASSQNRENGGSSVQGSSKKTITTCSVKRHGLQNKRDCKEVIRKSLPSESQETSLKGKDAHVLRQSKLSSNSLPVRNKSNSNGGSEVQFTNTFKRNKQKEEKEDVRLKEPQGPKKIVTPVTGNPRTRNKKVFPSGIGVQSNGGRKSQVNSMSLDGRKPRHATPPWR